MGTCKICGDSSPLISKKLGLCKRCIVEKPEKALEIAEKVHARSRLAFGLPPKPPQNPKGILCGICRNNCRIGNGETGYCGLVKNINGRLTRLAGAPSKGLLEWYYDPLPTNCVAWWFCPGCTGRGHPKYAVHPHAETDYSNLAVFYGSCSYDCLYCQNWHYRRLASKLKPAMSAQSLAEKADKHVSCICYFGGDPSTQALHAIKTSRLAVERAKREKRVLRICWESNGYFSENIALEVARLSLESGGVVKFDLKFWNENLCLAVCGVSNKPSFDNFKVIGERFYGERLEVPVLTASTLLVPGYVDEQEVERIAEFISSIDPSIPYTLLAFYPCYIMDDLPTTSRKLAYECYKKAKKHLENVRIGNVNLLS